MSRREGKRGEVLYGYKTEGSRESRETGRSGEWGNREDLGMFEERNGVCIVKSLVEDDEFTREP